MMTTPFSSCVLIDLWYLHADLLDVNRKFFDDYDADADSCKSEDETANVTSWQAVCVNDNGFDAVDSDTSSAHEPDGDADFLTR